MALISSSEHKQGNTLLMKLHTQIEPEPVNKSHFLGRHSNTHTHKNTQRGGEGRGGERDTHNGQRCRGEREGERVRDTHTHMWRQGRKRGWGGVRGREGG